ncbi:hypothetical protein E8E12_001527 [Didymella heteroderae]|uniref:Uncharacterized protein n=1 Tax=Didymella heteroderae TaxID=1769908 RepID=A0A9P5BZW3_9PLEO|nr:hypothetical protein E8E12_001527 [Didymella heteroderae]
MFFKRRSSRANSYVEHDGNRQSFDDFSEKRPESSRTNQPLQGPPDADEQDMYARQQQQQQPQEQSMPMRGMSSGAPVPAMAMGSAPLKPEPMPDLLAAAFNQAVRPYTEKIEQLESQLADMQSWVEQLEAQRAEVHSWIDKRGLRPDVPSSIAKIMDTTTPDAAHTLNAQLDRKITIVNFDLHRLQDDLNDSISSAHFASSMLKFLPDIQRLTLLPQGPKYAFDLILKLGGNLNSHGGLDSADTTDIAARRDFYSRLDAAMVDVVQRRFGEGEEWNVQREIKRIEKTASYLKTYGVEPYFPQTREVMAREMEFQPNGAPNGQGTPPRLSEKGGRRSPSFLDLNGVDERVLSIFAFGRGVNLDNFEDMSDTTHSESVSAELDYDREHFTSFDVTQSFPVYVDRMSQWSNGRGDQVKTRTFHWINNDRHARGIRHVEYDYDATLFTWVRTSALSGNTPAIHVSVVDNVKPPPGFGPKPEALSEQSLERWELEQHDALTRRQARLNVLESVHQDRKDSTQDKTWSNIKGRESTMKESSPDAEAAGSSSNGPFEDDSNSAQATMGPSSGISTSNNEGSEAIVA